MRTSSFLSVIGAAANETGEKIGGAKSASEEVLLHSNFAPDSGGLALVLLQSVERISYFTDYGKILDTRDHFCQENFQVLEISLLFT